jgi:hypothetical protein
MKYIIEIISPTAFEHPLSRAIVECTDLVGAQCKAMPLLEIWTKHGATHARVLNLDGMVAVEVRLEHARAG